MYYLTRQAVAKLTYTSLGCKCWTLELNDALGWLIDWSYLYSPSLKTVLWIFKWKKCFCRSVNNHKKSLFQGREQLWSPSLEKIPLWSPSLEKFQLWSPSLEKSRWIQNKNEHQTHWHRRQRLSHDKTYLKNSHLFYNRLTFIIKSF